jgi:hypothetical protein
MNDFKPMLDELTRIEYILREKLVKKGPQFLNKLNKLTNDISEQKRRIEKMASEGKMRTSTIQKNKVYLSDLENQFKKIEGQLDEFVRTAAIYGYDSDAKKFETATVDLVKATNNLDDLLNEIENLQLGGKKKRYSKKKRSSKKKTKSGSKKNKRTSKKISKKRRSHKK